MSNCLKFFLGAILCSIFLPTESANAQQGGAGSPVIPGAAVRERNRQMDEYDRELERLRNGATVPSERRRNLFPQINEDFQRIQVIHNEFVKMIQRDNSLDYDRLIELTGELKKRSNRLRTNLALPDADNTDETRSEIGRAHV